MRRIRVSARAVVPPAGFVYSVWDDSFVYNVWQLRDGTPTNVTQFGSPEGDNGIHDPVLSPDGTMIAYCQDNGGAFDFPQLYVIPSVGGTPLLLDDGADAACVLHPCWRPDSGKIVYTVGATSGNFQGESIYEINPDGTGKSLLISVPTADYGFVRPQYNRDGTLIAYMSADFNPTQSDEELRVMNADGSGDAAVDVIGVLQQEGSQFAFANTSDRIAYNNPSLGEVYTIDPDGTDKVTVSNATESWYLPKTAWAPDDSYLIGSDFRDCVSYDPAGGGVTPVGSEMSMNESDRRQFYLWEGRVYFLQDTPTHTEAALCSFLPDGTDFRKDHVLTDTGASEWSGTSGIELL